MLHSLIALTAIFLNLLCAVLLTKHIHKAEPSQLSASFRYLLLLSLISHSAFLSVSLFKDQLLHLNFYTISPLIFFMIIAILWGSLWRKLPIENLLLAFLPLTALSIAVAAWAPAKHTEVLTNPELITHTVLSIIAYSLITIAALQALMLAIQEHALKQRRLDEIIRFFPPLQSMEKLLFQMMSIGFVFLSLSIASGFIVFGNLFDPQLLEKTSLSLIAWLIFAVLLYGRYAKGLRGPIATYWTIGGFIVLMLAYFGSKFVLTFMLHNS